MKQESATIEIVGIVERIFFSSPKFTTGRLRKRDDGKEIPFAGRLYVREGESIKLIGKWAVHPKYGHQFSVEDSSTQQDIDPAGLAQWLTKNARAIGPVRAAKIVNELGESFSEVLKNDIERFAKVAVIPVHVAKELSTLWCERESVNAVETQLAAYGLKQFEIKALTSAFEDGAAKLVHDDPYRLLGFLDGFGWKRVDEIANKIGLGGTHPGRIRAAAITAVKSEYQNGSTACRESVLIDNAAELLDLGKSGVSDPTSLILASVADIVNEVQDSRLRLFDLGAAGRFYALHGVARSELIVRDFLKTGNRPNPNVLTPDLIPKIAAAFSTVGVNGSELSPDQMAALTAALSHRIVLISGGAGTGKTTVVRAIYDAIKIGCNGTVALCAPTGKAARRMEEVIPNSTAFTIHRLLAYGRDPETGHLGFQRNRDSQLDVDCVIVDEVSMLDIALAAHLFEAIPDKCSVVLVGDHNQLPAVGAGAILRDVIKRNLTPVALLNHCHRQAGPLKTNCAAILSGHLATSESHATSGPGPWYVFRGMDTTAQILEKIESLFTKSLPGFCFDPIQHVQFMSPMHKGPIGVKAINALIQRLYQKSLGNDLPPHDPEKPLKLHVGDKCIQTANDYELGVMNGTIGIVVDNAGGGGTYIIDFSGKIVTVPAGKKGNIELAYCLTPHKMQGSEIACAVVICHSSQSFMLNRNWLYTGCTRAQKTAIVLANEMGIRVAMREVAIDNRRTLLEVME